MLDPLSLLLRVYPLVAQAAGARAEDVAVRDRRGVGEYIQAGLGATITTTATFYEVITTAVPYSASSNHTSEDYDALATCAASWSSYDILAANNTRYITVPYTTATLINTTIVYGTGDVYTSYGRIPVVAGGFTPTRTANRLLNVSITTFSYASTTSNPALITQTPACSFSPKDCSRLYVSYVSSLGLPYNASVPKITPAPQNSPDCPDYYYKPYTTSYVSTQSDLTADCKLYGNSVELFYFPSTTEGQPQPTTPVTYEYKEGTTFTSPSIYLSFDYIKATRYVPLSVDSYQVTCGEKGCRTQAVGGGNEIEDEGTTISGQILTMAPSDVSSIVLKYDAAMASGIISTVVDNLPGYGNVAQDINLGAIISQSLTAERLQIEDLVHPPPRAYYLRPEGAPGCGSLIYSPRCGTIFEADYRAIISLPSDVSLLQGAWKTCNPAIYGVYDPPIALTQQASVAKPTLPPGVTAPAYETTPALTIAGPYTILPPLATAAMTALRDSLPSATRGMIMHPGGSLAAPSAASGSDGNEISGQVGKSASGQDQSADRTGASSESGPSAFHMGAPGETKGSGSGMSGIAASDRGSGAHDTSAPAKTAPDNTVPDSTATSNTATADRSESRASIKASSDSSSMDRSQTGSSTATADRSESRASINAPSDASSTGRSQTGSSTRLSAFWRLCAGGFLLALAF